MSWGLYGGAFRLIFFSRVNHTHLARSYEVVITLCYSVPVMPTVNYSRLITTCKGPNFGLDISLANIRCHHLFSGITIQAMKLENIQVCSENDLMNLVNCKAWNISPTGSIISALSILCLSSVIFCSDSTMDELRGVFMPVDGLLSEPRFTDEPLGVKLTLT